MRQPELFNVPTETVAAQELKLAKTLIETSTAKEPNLDEYHDLYAERLNELIQANMEGKHFAKASSKKSAPPVINFAEVLKMSLAEKKQVKRPSTRKSSAAKAAPSKRRKSG